MARLHPACSSIQFRGQRGESAPCWRSIRQHLLHFCTDGEKTADSHTHTHAHSSSGASPLTPVLQMLRRGERWSASSIRACLKACL